jgi:hypothetical protein
MCKGQPAVRFVAAGEVVSIHLSGPGLQTRLLGYSDPMPLYFFNFSRAPKPEAIPFKNEGLELVDDDAAWEEATIACGEKRRQMDGALGPRRRLENGSHGWSGRNGLHLTFSSEACDRGKR